MNKYIAAALAEDHAARAQRAGERAVAVQREIDRDPRIKGREAAAIHALLKGRRK